jgi:hypothetical protein
MIQFFPPPSETMKQAGVVGNPEIYFLQLVRS